MCTRVFKLPFTVLFFIVLSTSGFAQTFDLIPLGVYGGGDESNLSAYLLGEKGKNEFISLDAGTIRAGIIKAIDHGVFDAEAETVLKNYIKGYFISHGHLDHLAGLIINSPDDSPKNIYGIPYTIDILMNHYFRSGPWDNFTNEGEPPYIGTYTYQRKTNTDEFTIENTGLKGRIFELSHVNPNKSSAILVTNTSGNSVLYLGDTGADRVEKSDKLNLLWSEITPLVANKTLKAIMIEVSFPNSRDENLLFGHLTPKLLTEELNILAEKAGRTELADLKIIVTHLKPGGNQVQAIKKELADDNPLKLEYIFPKQGVKIEL